MVSLDLIPLFSFGPFAKNITDGPADTLESDSKLKPGQKPVIRYDSPANK